MKRKASAQKLQPLYKYTRRNVFCHGELGRQMLLLKKKVRDTDVRRRGAVGLWDLSLDSTSNQATSTSYATIRRRSAV